MYRLATKLLESLEIHTTVCPRNLGPFYIVIQSINLVRTSGHTVLSIYNEQQSDLVELGLLCRPLILLTKYCKYKKKS